MQLCKCGGEIVFDINGKTVCSICGVKWKDRQPVKLGDLIQIKMRQLRAAREAQREAQAVPTQ